MGGGLVISELFWTHYRTMINKRMDGYPVPQKFTQKLTEFTRLVFGQMYVWIYNTYISLDALLVFYWIMLRLVAIRKVKLFVSNKI